MHPIFPLLDDKFEDSQQRQQLVSKEPFVCTAILTIASRFVWVDGRPGSPRARGIHELLFKQVQSNIHNVVWLANETCGSERSIWAVVECILLFVEWVCVV